MFQKTVARQYTTGFPGDIVRDGPTRGKVARILSAVGNVNAITRAFGYSGEVPQVTVAANVATVAVGGANFFGILGHAKHYTTSGGEGGSLSPTIDLPNGAEGEFFDMVTGMVIELFNPGTAVAAVTYGAQVAYLLESATAEQNPNDLPVGALIPVAKGASAPAGYALIPNAMIVNAVSIAASAPDTPVAAYTIVQLTQ